MDRVMDGETDRPEINRYRWIRNDGWTEGLMEGEMVLLDSYRPY